MVRPTSAVLALLAVLAVLVLQPAAPPAGAEDADTEDAEAPWTGHYTRGRRNAVPPAPTPVQQADGRTAYATRFVPFAAVGGIELRHPAAVVELVGLHQSNHEGARDLAVAGSAAPSVVLPSRGRLSGRQSAADVVVPPGTEIRSPVTGTVLRAGTYVLYCEHSDDFLVVEPDGHPGFEVKVLHIDGVAVGPGDRVVAGETAIAPRATVLPFRSQVDASTAAPSWPHVHVEVIDTSIPDVPNGGSGSGC